MNNTTPTAGTTVPAVKGTDTNSQRSTRTGKDPPNGREYGKRNHGNHGNHGNHESYRNNEQMRDGNEDNHAMNDCIMLEDDQGIEEEVPNETEEGQQAGQPAGHSTDVRDNNTMSMDVQRALEATQRRNPPTKRGSQI